MSSRFTAKVAGVPDVGQLILKSLTGKRVPVRRPNLTLLPFDVCDDRGKTTGASSRVNRVIAYVLYEISEAGDGGKLPTRPSSVAAA